MAYLETMLPRDFHPYTLFCYPFEEGVRNFRVEMPKQPALWGRVKHAVVGILLLIPLINTLVFLILRKMVAQPVVRDDIIPLPQESMPEQLRELNRERNLLISQWNIFTSQWKALDETGKMPSEIPIEESRGSSPLASLKEQLITQWNNGPPYNKLILPESFQPWTHFTQLNETRDQLLSAKDRSQMEIARKTYALIVTITSQQISLIEQQVLEENLIELVHVQSVSKYLQLSENRNERLTRLDRRLYLSGSRNIEHRNHTLSFTQVGGVHQHKAVNQLCGYHALFYLFQAVNRSMDFANRNTWHPLLVRWTTMIAKYRTRSWLSSHRGDSLPAKIQVPVRGLTPSEMDYLIENDPELNCLRNTNNCFVMELDVWNSRVGQEGTLITEGNPAITALGNKILDANSPLHFVAKIGAHYFCLFADTPGQFKVVHSLGYRISNPCIVPSRVFIEILECLEFSQFTFNI